MGYALLFLGLILNLFDTKSRFWQLITEIKRSTLSVCFIILCSATPLFSHSEYTQTYLDEHRVHSRHVSQEFGRIVVQSRMGRMKPFDTLSMEVLYKLSGKSTLEKGMNPTQVMLGMLSHPSVWKKFQ